MRHLSFKHNFSLGEATAVGLTAAAVTVAIPASGLPASSSTASTRPFLESLSIASAWRSMGSWVGSFCGRGRPRRCARAWSWPHFSATASSYAKTPTC